MEGTGGAGGIGSGPAEWSGEMLLMLEIDCWREETVETWNDG